MNMATTSSSNLSKAAQQRLLTSNTVDTTAFIMTVVLVVAEAYAWWQFGVNTVVSIGFMIFGFGFVVSRPLLYQGANLLIKKGYHKVYAQVKMLLWLATAISFLGLMALVAELMEDYMRKAKENDPYYTSQLTQLKNLQNDLADIPSFPVLKEDKTRLFQELNQSQAELDQQRISFMQNERFHCRYEGNHYTCSRNTGMPVRNIMTVNHPGLDTPQINCRPLNAMVSATRIICQIIREDLQPYLTKVLEIGKQLQTNDRLLADEPFILKKQEESTKLVDKLSDINDNYYPQLFVWVKEITGIKPVISAYTFFAVAILVFFGIINVFRVVSEQYVTNEISPTMNEKDGNGSIFSSLFRRKTTVESDDSDDADQSPLPQPISAKKFTPPSPDDSQYGQTTIGFSAVLPKNDEVKKPRKRTRRVKNDT
jgi:hypothetical protein